MKKKMTANGRGPDPAPPPPRARGIAKSAEVRPLGCRCDPHCRIPVWLGNPMGAAEAGWDC